MHSQDVGSRSLRFAWGRLAPSTRGPRARFTMGDIAAAGIRLADASGLEHASLHAIAAKLGLSTAALYRYIDSKAALFQTIVDTAIGPPPTLAGHDWRADARQWTTALWQRYLTHPWLAGAPTSGAPHYPNAIGWIDELLRALGPAVQQPMQLALLLDAVARSFSLLTGPAPSTTAAPDWLADAIEERFPHFAQRMHRNWNNAEDELDGAVSTILAGVAESASHTNDGSRSPKL